MANETKKRLLLSKWHESQWAGSDHEKYHEIVWRAYELERALVDVKYWLHDGIVLHKLVSSPRILLRKVEEVLDT